MGADIHCFIEYRTPGSDYWRPMGRELGLSRNYGAFSLLAGVRGDDAVYEPRGLPDGELSYWARAAFYLIVSDHPSADDWDGFTTPEKAEKYAGYGKKYKADKDGVNRWIEHPDWHTPTWLAGSEWRHVVSGIECGHEYRAIGSAMSSLEAEGYETRAVFWFDN